MSFIEDKNGDIVESITEVRVLGCAQYEECDQCPLERLRKEKNIRTCADTAEKYPATAARLFGYRPLLEIDKAGDQPSTTPKEASAADEADAPSEDMVNRPSHYTMGGIECIDAIEAAIGHHEDPVEAFLTGQVMKYIWRWPHKAKPLEDLKKTKWYLDRLIAHREKKEAGNGQ